MSAEQSHETPFMATGSRTIMFQTI